MPISKFDISFIWFTIITALVGCEGNFMPWVKLPIPEIEHLRTNALLISGNGSGYAAGSLFTEESGMELDPRKALSMDSSVIYETINDWKDRQKAFTGSGEIVAMFRTGVNSYIAQNTQNNKESFLESTHFIRFEKNKWHDVSNLDLRGTKVWGSEGQWLLAAGYPEYLNEPVVIFVSRDAGLSWLKTDLAGYNPLALDRDTPLYLTENGSLFRMGIQKLEQLNLNQPLGFERWEEYRSVPADFKILWLAGNGNAIWAFGSSPDKKYHIAHFSTTDNSIQECRNLPSDFLFISFSVTGDIFHLIGAVELKRGTETVGFKSLILESRNFGVSWIDLELPITGSLNAFDFESNGRIWAVAAGNRMQILLPKQIQ